MLLRDEDNPPLAITGIRAEGNGYRVNFLAAKDTQFRVYYGSDSAHEPAYDTAAIIQALGERFSSQRSTLGPVVENPDYRSSGKVALLDSPWVFVAAVALMVVALGTVAYRAIRRVYSLPSDE
jgi:hypothetical protein